MIFTKSIEIDIAHQYLNDVIRLHEGDVNGAQLLIAVYDNGEAFDLTSFSVKYDAAIAGYLAESDAAATKSGNVITVPITANMCAASGTLEIDIKIIEGSGDNASIFFFQKIEAFVQRRVLNEDVIIDVSGTTIKARLEALEARFPVVTQDISDNAVTGAKIASGAIKQRQLDDNSVTTPKIENDAVTPPKIANGSVTAAKIAENAVTGAALSQSAIDKILTHAMSLAPSVPVNSGNTAPDTSSSEFSALNTGQLFKCVFTGGKVTYWMKDGGQRATQLTVDITGKMDLTPFTSETADNSFKKGQIAVSNGEVILKTAEIGNSGHKSLLEKQTTLPEVFTREYHGEWIVDTSDSTFQNLPIGYFFTAEIREVVTVYEKIGSSDYISVSDQATIGYVDSALLTKADQTAVEDIKAYIGYTDGDILGLQADFENSVFTRLAGAVGKTAGSDFDAYPMFGNRRRCNVEANGNIRAYYGDSGYYEDGNGGQVMVYQPAFFYKVVPLKLEKNAAGLGYHIRKANYYVSATPKPGFKRHPLFYDEQGNEIDYVLLSAYEGSMFDVSETAYVNDSVDTVTYGAGDLLCSVAGKKPISGKLTGIGTKANLETMANNYGSGWHLDTIKSVSANQLLMMIELGTLNTQTAIGQGVVNQSGSSNASSLTGSTSALGSATGMASQTTAESAGTETVNTTNGKLSVSYRGVENPWGNIWKHVNGINIWGDGTMGGGQIYIADGFTFNESSSADPYRATGISIANSNGYISAFGYGDEEFDWLLVPSECGGNSSLPVGDYCYVTSGLNGYRIVHWGGLWNSGDYAGGCGWRCTGFLGNRDSYFGGRLLYIPQ